ncbi:hypothetical protein P153DRAFT_369436 [Dothidotthia symphoricarpi CBS 119687]|uniref:Uncharacterized protein n=1 Tax=Dothidotthia symphoricarpi CBS 119687 TaxID=1392245 RepID=A0A6A6A4G7_9PLEO|nr:uncharacterized protein P153DRAFT_369436 [Dothidotthia symphoricarpi CBS 119687]KAF2126065.1 hypothetical protein P153DRAFT_369436 [Dothidotthia symphoricarpi CBS 119687]
MRLERAFLLEQLQKHQEYNMDDSDRSSSPPPTPTDKPLRSKRSHRKGTPPVGADGAAQHLAFGGAGPLHHMSSAQSTPDPGRQPTNPFFSTLAAAGSPHAVNVNGAHVQQQQSQQSQQQQQQQQTPTVLPPLHAITPIQQQQQQRPSTYFDPAYDEQRPTPADHDVDAAGRRRAYSGAQHPPLPQESAPLNGDTDMVDAGAFTAVNR